MKLHVRKLIAVLVLAISGILVVTAQEEAPSKLPIDVPTDAMISFEAEGSGKQFIPIVKHLLEVQDIGGNGGSIGKITLKTGLGSIDFTLDDFAPLVEQLHDIHIVIYGANVKGDPFKMQEGRLGRAGLKRVLMAPGSDGPLVMKRSGREDQLAIVFRAKGSITVLRTEGGPNLGDFGRIAFGAFGQLIQQSVRKKKR